MAGDLAGKVIVITGGADGIGRECAFAYVRDGARVAILDNNLEAAKATAAELGGRNVAFFADVGDGPSVQAALRSALQEFGRIDAVHNNAGIASPSKPWHANLLKTSGRSCNIPTSNRCTRDDALRF